MGKREGSLWRPEAGWSFWSIPRSTWGVSYVSESEYEGSASWGNTGMVTEYLVMPLIVAVGGGNMVHTVGLLTGAAVANGVMFRGMHHARVSSSTALA